VHRVAHSGSPPHSNNQQPLIASTAVHK
jgi:hypothetical protein